VFGSLQVGMLACVFGRPMAAMCLGKGAYSLHPLRPPGVASHGLVCHMDAGVTCCVHICVTDMHMWVRGFGIGAFQDQALVCPSTTTNGWASLAFFADVHRLLGSFQMLLCS
jgi:hypothetical protein